MSNEVIILITFFYFVTRYFVISKKYRLHEREVKKVLQRWKPFFSYSIVLNYIKNNIWYSRFAIVIWAKSVTHNVTRNFFRRRFYDFVWTKLQWEQSEYYDYVFVVKKKAKLDKTNETSIQDFYKDIHFLSKKILPKQK